MGQEIADGRFTPEDFLRFGERLERETRLLESWLREGLFPEGEHVGGFELEAWLVGDDATPAPLNETCIQELGDPLIVPELAKFNLELNNEPQRLSGSALTLLADGLATTWHRCDRLAQLHNAHLAMIGILPTVSEDDLSLDNMSPMQRYHALDEQLFKLRGGERIELDIEGREHLRMQHEDVMLEAATTSFQIHLKVNVGQAVRFYNASKILAAPMVALSANSPYLFGLDLWDETRIPLFEQSVAVGDTEPSKRVTFGVGYLKSTIMELFQANVDRYPVLLPRLMDDPETQLAHLRLHNGTIWRWNRPLVGISDQGVPHLRIEHRVIPAGPTIDDCVANAAFYFGLVFALANQSEPPERYLPYDQAVANFYRAARYSLGADVSWLDGTRGSLRTLCLEKLVPIAKDGLVGLGIDPAEAAHWVGIIEGRLDSRQTGAAWQRSWVERYGRDMSGLTRAYLANQIEGRPVHQWRVG